MEDLSRKRRDYLLAKGRANTIALVSAVAFVCLATLAVVGFGLEMHSHPFEEACEFALMIALPASVPGYIWYAARCKSISLVCVPPVREQVASLPAESVLVRGADEPEPVPMELLRSVEDTSRSADEELLRSSDSGDSSDRFMPSATARESGLANSSAKQGDSREG